MKLKISKTLLVAAIVLLQSTPSVGDKALLNVITAGSGEHQSLSQAVTEIIGSLEGDKPSATNVIKVTSHDADAKNIDLFTETIARSINGPFEFHIRDYDESKAAAERSGFSSALLILSPETTATTTTIREMEIFLLSLKLESHKKFLVVLLDKNFPSSRNSSIKLLLDIMWRKFILDVHVVASEPNGDVVLHTFFPFGEDFCGQVHPVVWNIYRNSAFVVQREHFPRKHGNLFGCSLRAAVFHAPPYMMVRKNRRGAVEIDGADGKMLKTLAEKLNFTINYTVVSEDVRWGEIYANHTATGALQLIQDKAVDITVGMFSKTPLRLQAISMSFSYLQTSLILVVPPGHNLSSVEKLLSPFHDSVWQVVFIMMTFIFVVTIILKHLSRRVQDFVFGKQIKTPFLNIINVITGLPMHKTPGRNFARWILTMFIIMWLVIRSLYSAVLYKKLQSTERLMPIQTIQESLNLGFVYYMLASTQENIKYVPELYSRRVVVSRLDSFDVIQTLNDPLTRAAFLGGANVIKYANLINLYGFKLTICNEALMLRQYGVVYPKGSFLIQPIDEILIVLVENGLIDYWMSEHTEAIKQPENVREPMKLTLNHLLSAYQLLLFGVGLASIVFVGELLSLRLKRLRAKFAFINKTSPALGAFPLNIH